MPTLKQWQERIAGRSDLCGQVTHLTKKAHSVSGKPSISSLQVLKKILKEKQLVCESPSLANLYGRYPAVCFQDAPLQAIVQTIRYEEGKVNRYGNPRYSWEGLMFPKRYVYNKGGRPVVYGDMEMWKKLLAEEEHWRIACLDLSKENGLIDFTHEREWRVLVRFEFEWSEVTVLVKDTKNYHDLVRDKSCKEIVESVG